MISLDLLTPLLLATLGALYSERAGLLNIALEGQILGGAFITILVQFFTGNLFLAIVAAALFGGVSSLILAWGSLRLGANPFIAALGLNLLIPALTGWVSYSLFGNQGVIRLVNPPPTSLWGVPGFFWLALGLTALSHGLLFHTAWGLRLRAAGTAPALMASRGLASLGYQTQGLLISGVLGAWAGTALAFSLGAFVSGMSAGKGWIALVALYLGLRRPFPMIVACLALSGAQQLANGLQVFRELPSGLVLALPSLITLGIFVITSARQPQR